MVVNRRSWPQVLVVLPALVLVLAAVAQCGFSSSGEDGEDTAGAPPVWVDEPECPAADPETGIFPRYDDSSERGGIPGDFETAWVLHCREEFRDTPGQGGQYVLVPERADASSGEGVAKLVAELRRRSDPRGQRVDCTAAFVIPPYILLVDSAGRALLPKVPTDVCGNPRQEVRDLVDVLPYRAVA